MRKPGTWTQTFFQKQNSACLRSFYPGPNTWIEFCMDTLVRFCNIPRPVGRVALVHAQRQANRRLHSHACDQFASTRRQASKRVCFSGSWHLPCWRFSRELKRKTVAHILGSTKKECRAQLHRGALVPSRNTQRAKLTWWASRNMGRCTGYVFPAAGAGAKYRRSSGMLGDTSASLGQAQF